MLFFLRPHLCDVWETLVSHAKVQHYTIICRMTVVYCIHLALINDKKLKLNNNYFNNCRWVRYRDHQTAHGVSGTIQF